MELTEAVKLIGMTFGSLSGVVGLIWGYAKLNSKADHTKSELEKLDSKTAEALIRINERVDVERLRVEKREDMLRGKMDSIEGNLSGLHIEVLKALTEKK